MTNIPIKYKVITVWQPWASFLAAGVKQYETRSWMHQYRGPIAIHAGKKWDGALRRQTELLLSRFPELQSAIDPDNPVLGAIVGTGQLTDIVTSDDSIRHLSPRERALGDWSPGRYGWRIHKSKLLQAVIPAPGKQGLWDWDGERVIDRTSWQWKWRRSLFYNTPGGIDAQSLGIGDVFDVIYPAKDGIGGVQHNWHGVTFVVTWSYLRHRKSWSRMVCPIHEWECSAAEIAAFERMRLEKAV